MTNRSESPDETDNLRSLWLDFWLFLILILKGAGRQTRRLVSTDQRQFLFTLPSLSWLSADISSFLHYIMLHLMFPHLPLFTPSLLLFLRVMPLEALVSDRFIPERLRTSHQSSMQWMVLNEAIKYGQTYRSSRRQE